MSHYPTLTGNVDDSGLHHMTLNLFGHTHQNVNFYEDNFMKFIDTFIITTKKSD